MGNKVSYVVVGLFVIGLGLALIAVVLWLAAGAAPKEYNTYVAYFNESVSGLNVKAPVKYRGVDVGRVQDIALEPENPEEVKLTLEIERGIPVKADTVATLNSQGLTGIAYVELSGGSRESPVLEPPPGRAYPVIKTAPSLFKRVDTAFSSLVTQAEELSTRAIDLLNADNRRTFGEILAHLDAISGVLAGHRGTIDQTIKDVAVVTENGARASAGLPELTASLQRSADQVEQTIRVFSKTAESFSRAADTTSAAVTETRRDLRRFTEETLPNMSAAMTDLRELVRTLQRFVQNLERDPNMLLFGRAQRRGPGE